MRICLTGPPTVEHVTQDTLSVHESARSIADRVPLGVLTLAAGLEQQGKKCSVVDLNRAFLDATRTATPRKNYVNFAADYLMSLEFDVLGLGTMCSSYPATLQIAAAIKARRPKTLIILGGPQASVTDMATLERFKSIDIVVRGEADNSFPTLINALENTTDLDSVPGITFRRNAEVVRTPEAPAILSLDSLPLPAFHQLPNVAEIKMLPLELGRGCPFSCTFCSTNDFFRRRFRLKRPESVLAQMRALEKLYGVRDFILVHDMFTVDRKRVVEFCQAMIDASTGYEWSCSARTDSVDEELLALMVKAGCGGLFFGVETGSTRMQRLIEKDLDMAQAMSIVATANTNKIYTTVSTIIGFPEEEIDDVEATMNFLADVSRLDYINPQVGILAILAATPLYLKHRGDLRFDSILPDFSYSSWYEDYRQFEMVREYPDIFSNFFAVPTRVPRGYLFELKLFFLAAFHQCRWLLVAAHQEAGGIVPVFERWLLYRKQPDNLVRYYISQQFKLDLSGFMEKIATEEPGKHLALALLSTAQQILVREAPKISLPAPSLRAGSKRAIKPVLSHGIEICELPGNVAEAIEHLRKNTKLEKVKPTRHLVRRCGESSEMLPLDHSIAKILELCDGNRSAVEIVHRATGVHLPSATITEFFSHLSRQKIVALQNETRA